MRRHWWWVVQGAVLVLVLALAARTVVRNWAEFRALDIPWTPRADLLAASVLLVFATYGLQVESWRRVLRGWGHRLRYRAAARAWFLANLGRYVPGKIWSVAGLVVLTQRAGIPPATAAASSVAIQALGVGTGVAVAAGGAPGHLSAAQLVGAAALATLTITALAWTPTARLLARVVPSAGALTPLPWPAVLAGGALTLTSWTTYGLAFWLLARGLVPAAQFGAGTAVGLFALGYLLGWVALFAPGGVGVRELALVGLLTPVLGSASALAVTLASRVTLTLTEVAAALAGLAFSPRSEGGAT